MAEEPSIPVIVERLANLQGDVTDIQRNMATRNDQLHVDVRISDLTGALAAEKTERVAAMEKERTERERGLSGLQAQIDEARKRTAQLWTSLGLIVATGIVGSLFLVFNRGLGLE